MSDASSVHGALVTDTRAISELPSRKSESDLASYLALEKERSLASIYLLRSEKKLLCDTWLTLALPGNLEASQIAHTTKIKDKFLLISNRGLKDAQPLLLTDTLGIAGPPQASWRGFLKRWLYREVRLQETTVPSSNKVHYFLVYPMPLSLEADAVKIWLQALESCLQGLSMQSLGLYIAQDLFVNTAEGLKLLRSILDLCIRSGFAREFGLYIGNNEYNPLLNMVLDLCRDFKQEGKSVLCFH